MALAGLLTLEAAIMTRITIQLPEDILQRLESAWPDVARGVLEAIAVEGYRSGALTHGDVSRLLDLSFWATEAFLKERGALLPYTESDLEDDHRDLNGPAL